MSDPEEQQHQEEMLHQQQSQQPELPQQSHPSMNQIELRPPLQNSVVQQTQEIQIETLTITDVVTPQHEEYVQHQHSQQDSKHFHDISITPISPDTLQAGNMFVLNPMSSDHTSEFLKRKEHLIHNALQSIDSRHWNFQNQVDKKARNHLMSLLLDHWELQKSHSILSFAWFQRRDNSGAPSSDSSNIVSDEELQKQFELSVEKTYKEMMREYKRWCIVAKVPPRSTPYDTIQERIAALLLLLMIFGEADIVRSQNHVCFLLLHIGLRMAFSDEHKAKMLQGMPPAMPTMDYNPYHSPIQSILPEFESSDDSMSAMDQNQHPTIGGLVRREARLVYNLMSLMFDSNKRNDQFFDWDDLNDLCWTEHFVRKFIVPSKKNREPIESYHIDPLTKINPFFIGGFERALGLKRYPLMQKVISMHQEEMAPFIKSEGIEKNLGKEKFWFMNRWKTYFDRAGGILGWRGYMTYFLNWSAPVYYQLFCLAIGLGWMFNFQFGGGIANYVYAGISAFPLALMVVYFVLKHVVFRWWTSPLVHHPHYWSIPRRDTMSRGYEMEGVRITSFFIAHIRKYLHWRHLVSIPLVVLVTASYIAFMRWVLFETVRQITYDTIEITVRLGTGAIAASVLTGADYANLILTYMVFALLWTSILFMCVIIAPILLQCWVGVFGFIRGIQLQVNRVNCWADLRRCFMDKKLILSNFRRKMLAGVDYNDNDLIECSFATVWNAILDDFYENHQLSKSERDRLSYTFRTGTSVQISKRPELDTRPVNSQVRHHLIKFVNNLYMRSMPSENIRIIDMKRLCVFTPVFKEKIYYSWEELVRPGNTNSSFLKALILKYPEDWKNFKEKEFPSGNRLRITVDYIEAKVLAGIDITAHKVHASTTTHFMKAMIRSWASQRFQPVSRTVKGFMKVPKAMAILLRLQNPELSDEQVRSIVRQKFSYVVGAQLYDKKVWNQTTRHDTLSASDQKKNIQEHREYVEGLDELCKSIGDSMLKIAFVKQTKTPSKVDPNVAPKYTSVLRTFNGDRSEDVYQIESFGNFSRTGQGKPTNQAFMMQFFDGSYCQTIDCNMDSTLSQSLFVPNVLKEFDRDSRVKIVGCSEYITTKAWSKAGYAAAFTERVFGSMVQRVWYMIGLRFHYGHPDFMRGLHIMFTSGLSKLSYISEDIFNGFDCLLNNGISKHIDYFEVGKARDVCMISTTKFNRKIAGGGAQIACSRYAKLILTSRHLTYIDKLLFCYSVIAHYANTTLTIASAFVLYFSRQIILLAIYIYVRATPFDRTTITGSAIGLVTQSLRLVSDSMFLFQVGMALSFPGILQNVLDRGILRGLYEYITNFVWLLIYSMFQLLNTAFYFHNGFNQSAKYIASGRVTGLEHTTIIDTWRTFKSTHFIPAIIMMLLLIIGLITTTNWGFVVYHCLMIFIWFFSPFLFNTGALPYDVSVSVWKQLYAEDLFRIKTWIRNNCKAQDVEKIMLKNRTERHLGLEYEFYAEKTQVDHLELDLEMGYDKKDQLKNNRTEQPQLPMIQLQSNMQHRKINWKGSRMNFEDREAPTANETLVRYGKRRRGFHFIFVQPFILIKFCVFLIPKLFLLLILYVTKLLSYLILLYKILAPWTSPPDYLSAYQEQYHVKITESRLLNIQRLFGKFKEEMTSGLPQNESKMGVGFLEAKRRRDTNSSATNLLKHSSISSVNRFDNAIPSAPILPITSKDLITRLEQIRGHDTIIYQELCILAKEISVEQSKSAQTTIYLTAVKTMKMRKNGLYSNREFLLLCERCSDYTFNPNHNVRSSMSVKEIERLQLIHSMAMLYLFYQLEQFKVEVKTVIQTVDILLKNKDSRKFEKAAQIVVQAGTNFFTRNRTAYYNILISDNPQRKKVNNMMRDQLNLLLGQLCKISQTQMKEAKSYFRAFSIKENQLDLFQVRTPTIGAPRQQCSTCQQGKRLMKVKNLMERTLNFVTRITENRPSYSHRKQYQSANVTSIAESSVFESDNGFSLFDQMFPIYADETQDVKYTDRIVEVNKSLLFDDLYRRMLEHFNAKIFSMLENDCYDMLAYLQKRKNELVCTTCQRPYVSKAFNKTPVTGNDKNGSDTDNSDDDSSPSNSNVHPRAFGSVVSLSSNS